VYHLLLRRQLHHQLLLTMNRSDNIADLAAALAKAQSQIEGARKGNVNPAFRSKYADLGAVWDAIREPLTSNGLAVLQQLGTDENRVSCTTMLLHASGQWIEFAPFTVPVTKQDAQGYGSAATYARRYSLMAAVGIAPIDDDGEAAVGRSSAPAAMPEPAVDPARQKIVRKVADACIAKHAAGDAWGCYEEASAITQPDERVLLWQYLHDHSKVRSTIKEMAELEKKQKVAA
jgi:hypothetical protein